MPVNLAKMKEKEEELKKQGGQFWTPKDGKNKIRIAPPQEGMDEFFAEGGFHYKVGPEEKSFPCPRLGQERPDCFLCNKTNDLDKGDEDDKAEAKEIRANKRYIIPIIDLMDKTEDGEVKGPIQFWLAGSTAFKQVISYFTDDQYGDISDPDTGYNLTVTKSGKGMKTEYEVRADKNESLWPKELDDLVEPDALPNPWDLLNYASNDDMESAYDGTGGGGSAKASEDKPARAGGRSRREAAADDGEAPAARGSRSSGTTSRSRPPRGEAPEFPDEGKPDPDGEPVEEPVEEPEAEPAPRHARGERASSEPAPRSTRRQSVAETKPEGTSRRLGRALRD